MVHTGWFPLGDDLAPVFEEFPDWVTMNHDIFSMHLMTFLSQDSSPA